VELLEGAGGGGKEGSRFDVLGAWEAIEAPPRRPAAGRAPRESKGSFHNGSFCAVLPVNSALIGIE
jgi:hypothetical protein